MKLFSHAVHAIVVACCLAPHCTNAQTTNSTNQPTIATESKTVVKLRADEKEKVSLFVSKRLTFPGPSTNEVREAVEVLLLQSCGKAEVEALLGNPSHSPKREGTPSPQELWQYDVGDSRAISVVFDAKGQVSAVLGTGVGFRQLECSPATNGVRRVVEK
jgi:hypothetical protein